MSKEEQDLHFQKEILQWCESYSDHDVKLLVESLVFDHRESDNLEIVSTS